MPDLRNSRIPGESPAPDQAAGLRQLLGVRPVRVIPFLTNQKNNGTDAIVSHLAASHTRAGYKVLVIDADRSLIGAWLGLKLRFEMRDWLTRECSLNEIIQRSQEGFWVMSGANGFLQLKGTSDAREVLKRLAFELSCMEALDLILITAPIETLQQFLGSQLTEVWMITNTDPQSVKATYRKIKTVITGQAVHRFRMIYSEAPDASVCEQAHVSLSQTIEQFTGAGLYFGGAVSQDAKLRYAKRSHSSLVNCVPSDPLALSFEQMASSMTSRPLSEWSFGPSETFLPMPRSSFAALAA